MWAATHGADAIGFIFAESPRKVSTGLAKQITESLPEEIFKVGVFVNADPQAVLNTAREAGLDWVQLHGEETPEDVAALRAAGLKVIKAFRVRDATSLEDMLDYNPDLFLLDAYSVHARGGTGERFEWELAKRLKGRDNIVVSGGLSPENVRDAVMFFEPYGVDASSSLESSPGVKDPLKVRRFIDAAKG